MLAALTSTSNDLTLTLIRIALGIVIFPHGAQKLLGWFGGHGYKGTMGYFTGVVKLPALVAFLVIFAEFFGSLALITGLLGRLGALGIIAVMVGAVSKVHAGVGFFMNWNQEQGRGEGFEYHLLAIAMGVVVLVQGSGAWSLDRLFFN